MSAYDPMPTRQCPLIAPLLPRRESKDLHRIEHRRGPALGERHAATRWKRTACEGTAHDEAWRSVSNGGPIRVAARPFAASDVEAAFDGFGISTLPRNIRAILTARLPSGSNEFHSQAEPPLRNFTCVSSERIEGSYVDFPTHARGGMYVW
jgi:hypothetical protein